VSEPNPIESAIPPDLWPRIAAELRHVQALRLHGRIDISLFTVNGQVVSWSVGSSGKNSPSRSRTQN
jgi:hypothetical protein